MKIEKITGTPQLKEDSIIFGDFAQGEQKRIVLRVTDADIRKVVVKGICSCTTVNTKYINSLTLEADISFTKNAIGKVLLIKKDGKTIKEIKLQ